jgi:hypothetical protein
MKITKWYTTTEWVDIETGELIPKNVAVKKYYIVNKTKKTELNENYGILKYTNECRPTNQRELFEL